MIDRRWMFCAALCCAWSVGCAAESSSDDASADGDSSTGGDVLPEGCDQLVEPGANDQEALVTALVEAADGSTICLGAGEFAATKQLVLTAPGVTLKGAGADATIIDFTGLEAGGGANGILINADDVTMQDLQVRNTPGDGIRADQVANISFIGVKVVWEALHSLENGAYGLYPVQSDGVTIQGCTVEGARDAGIYVGQSTNIVVEDSEAYDNVAGIEIENSIDAIVRRNKAYNNTAGILVFNLPGLDVKDGKRTNVYENEIYDNNVVNFADPGTIVGIVPPGVGVLVLAADQTEIHDNDIHDNESVGVALIAYAESAGIFPAFDDPAYDTYSEGNWVHDNTFTNNGTMPADLVTVLLEGTSPGPDIVFDGCFDEAKPNTDGALTNCVSGQDGASFLQANLCGQQTMVTPELGDSACMQDPLPVD